MLCNRIHSVPQNCSNSTQNVSSKWPTDSVLQIVHKWWNEQSSWIHFVTLGHVERCNEFSVAHEVRGVSVFVGELIIPWIVFSFIRFKFNPFYQSKMIQNNDEAYVFWFAKKEIPTQHAELQKFELKRLLLNNGCNLFSSCLHRNDGKRAFCPN